MWVFLSTMSWPDTFHISQSAIRWPLTGAYLGVLLAVCIYGLHRYWLLWLYYRHRHEQPQPAKRFADLPKVTVQLPMFNEGTVSKRIIDAACALDYPADQLQIQVLDDSTDGSQAIAQQRALYWADRGINIQFLHREHQHGYKAGALAAGLQQADGQFLVIFDADFVPRADFIKRTIHYFTDPGIGMVQTRWDHLNRTDSLLTRSQAIFLDGHFVIEHAARYRAGRWFNFNGTAGVWRRQAIESAGGWQHDTLTEDVDLSYRAQMAGWKFVFLSQVTCPAEVPPEINAFKAQQHRWTKGSIQTARKLLWNVLRSSAPLRVKIEAFFHLTSPMVYLYMTLMVLLFYPACFVNMQPFESGSAPAIVLGMSLFALGTTSAGAFYVASQSAQGRSVLGTLIQIPVLMSIGIGIALNNARGCVEALLGHQSGFVRTPKYNTTAQADTRRTQMVMPTPSIKLWMSLLEIAMGLYTLQCARLSLSSHGSFITFPFMLLFASGYLYVGITSLYSQWSVWRVARGAVVLPS